MSDRLAGTEIGHFLLEEQIGKGGMGVVYRAQDLVLERTVAVKLLAPELVDRPAARTRFQREITRAATLEHPHIVPVYNGGLEDGHFFIAMRFVEGPDLAEVLHRDGPLPEPRVSRLLGQVASALEAVHAKGVIHRDIKPQNVLIWNAGEADEHAFLTDFGIASALDDTRRLTTAGVVGTRGYMAPELVPGAVATPACDQFSLGCVAYELLTGNLPREDDDAAAEPSADLFSASPGSRTSRELQATILRALALDPKNRFPDLRVFVSRHKAAHDAFERSEAISDTVSRSRSDSDLVEDLHTAHGLTDARIAEITDLERSRVVLLRRQAARRSLIGE